MVKGPSFSLRAVGSLSEILSWEGCVQSCILHFIGLKEEGLEEDEGK